MRLILVHGRNVGKISLTWICATWRTWKCISVIYKLSMILCMCRFRVFRIACRKQTILAAYPIQGRNGWMHPFLESCSACNANKFKSDKFQMRYRTIWIVKFRKLWYEWNRKAVILDHYLELKTCNMTSHEILSTISRPSVNFIFLDEKDETRRKDVFSLDCKLSLSGIKAKSFVWQIPVSLPWPKIL